MAQTLEQLYAEVDSHADTLSRKIGDDLGYMVSVTITYKIDSSKAGSLRRWIMVRDRNLPTEAAYWDGNKPEFMTAADNFPSQLQTQIETYQTANPTFERYQILNTFNTAKYAIVKGYVLTAPDTTTEKTYLFIKNGTNWLVRQIA
jgi:hypothetical protein